MRKVSHTPPTRLEQVAFVVFACAAIGAFGSAYDQAPAWLLWLPCVVSPFWKLERVPPMVHNWARYLAGALLAFAIGLGLIFMAFPVLSDQTARMLTLTAGYGLAFFAAVFVLGTPVWRPAVTLIPVVTGVLVVACFNTAAQIRPLLLTPGAAAFAYLVLTTREREAWKEWRHVAGWLVISALASAAVAWGIYTSLPLLQAQVEQATVRWFASQETEYGIFSMQSRLGDLEELKLSNKIVMRVWSARPQKLRGRVFTRFDGQTWHARALPGKPLVLAVEPVAESLELTAWLEDVPGNGFLPTGIDPTRAAAPGAVRTRIVQNVFNQGMLVSPANKRLVRAEVPSLRMDPFENLAPPLSVEVRIYGVVNEPRPAEAAAEPPAELRSEMLALPPETDPRWQQLAAQLAEGTASSEERVRKTVSYVHNAAQYSLKMGKFHSRQPVTEFFFEKKQGYCQYFASAAAILLRLEGIPTRYVTGFNVQEYNRAGAHFVVREADAHAWLEAYVPGKGWVEADPTPDAEFAARRSNVRSGWLAQATEWAEAELAEISIRLGQRDWHGALRWTWSKINSFLRAVFVDYLAVTLPVGLLVFWYRVVRRRKRRVARDHEPSAERHQPAQVDPALTALLSQLERAWTSRGVARPAARGLIEHVESIPPGRISQELRQMSREVAACYYRAVFGGIRPADDKLQRLRASIEEAARF